MSENTRPHVGFASLATRVAAASTAVKAPTTTANAALSAQNTNTAAAASVVASRLANVAAKARGASPPSSKPGARPASLSLTAAAGARKSMAQPLSPEEEEEERRRKRRRERAKKKREEEERAAAAAAEAAQPGRCEPVVNCLRKAGLFLQNTWRRMMAVPAIFVLVSYILPFAFELAVLALHFDELHSLPSNVPYLDWHLFPRRASYVVADMVLGILFSLRFVAGMFATKGSLWRYLVSAFGLVSVLTLPMMLYPGFDFYVQANKKERFVNPWQSPANTTLMLRPTSAQVLDRVNRSDAVTALVNRTGRAPSYFADVVADDIVFTVPSVAAWRIWIVYHIMQTIIFASSTVSKSFRAIVFQLLFIFALLFTCMGTMQLIFCVERGAFMDLGTALYFTVVTLTTVGYGDFVPTTTLGRAFIITQIFAAMLAIPVLLTESERLVKFLKSLTGYSGSERHVLVLGELTQTEFELLLTERHAGDGKDDPLHLVFVSPAEFTASMVDFLASMPNNAAEYVTLCVAPQLSRAELQRFTPQRADAALFYSSSAATALRGDYRTIAAAAALKLHQPTLPQYLMLRRTATAHLVEGAYVVFDRDFLRAALLGTSLQIPGFLPMFLNLLRLVPSKDVGKNPDEAYARLLRRRRRRRNLLAQVYGGEEALREEEERRRVRSEQRRLRREQGKKQPQQQQQRRSVSGGSGAAAASSSSSSTWKRTGASKGGDSSSSSSSDGASTDVSTDTDSSDDDDEDDVQFAHSNSFNVGKHRKRRRRIPSNWYDLYLAGARQNVYTIAVPEVLVGRTFVVAAFIVQLRTGATPIGLVRDSRVALNAGALPLTAADSLVVIANSWEELFMRFSKFPTTSTATNETAVTKIALRSKEVHFETQAHSGVTALWLASTHNCFPFQRHVVLVDLASFLTEPELCAEESFQREQFQVQDMLALASRFPKWQSFVLLSMSPISDLMQAQWAASGRQPIFHVRKSPLDPEALKLCRIGSCMSVLVFSSMHLGTNSSDDTFRSALLTVNRRVMDVVHDEMQIREEAEAQRRLAQEEQQQRRRQQQQQQQQRNAGGGGGAAGDALHSGTLLAATLRGGPAQDNNNNNADGSAGGGAPATTAPVNSSNGQTKKKKKTWEHPNVISVLGAPDEALLLSPEHRSFPGETLDHDAHCTAFATGGALCPTLLDGLLFRTYYNEYLPQIVELLLEPGAVQREKADQLTPALYDMMADLAAAAEAESKNAAAAAAAAAAASAENSKKSRRPGGKSDASAARSSSASPSGSGGNNSKKVVTFGQICRVMTASKVLCIGFSRVIDTPERGVETVGKVFFVTNPDLATPVAPDDYVFFLSPWSNDRLAREFFA